MIFELIVYSCLTTTDLSGDVVSKTCRWSSRGLYASEQRCNDTGRSEIGEKLVPFAFTPDPSLIEKFRCSPALVRQ